MTDEVLLIERDGAVAILTMNRPEALNALSLALEEALRQAFRSLRGDDTLRAIVLTGTGRGFSAGVDLKELEKTGTGGRNWYGKESLADIIRSCPVPVIAAVNGFAITGGLELALLADFMIASESAKFADTHARVGLTPSWGMTQNLPRRVGVARARQMSLTGGFVDAPTALAWGLVNEVLPDEELMPRARTLAQEIATTDALTMTRIRQLIAEGDGQSLDHGMALEVRMFGQHMHTLADEDIARNRAAVQARGRAQSGASGR